jgi:hypothetical protein
VALVQDVEDVVVDAFDCGGDEQAAEGGELLPAVAVAQDVLDLGGDVEVGEPAVRGPHDAKRVVGRAEEVGVGVGDVTGAVVDELGDVAEHDVGRDDAGPAVVDGRHGAVPTA